MQSPLIISLFFVFASCCSGARILGFFGIPSISHQVVYRELMVELASRGHNVTIVTTDPINKDLDNYNEISVNYIYEKLKFIGQLSETTKWIIRNFAEIGYFIFMVKSNEMCETYLTDPNISKLIRDQEEFDLFIVEHGPLYCTYPFAMQSNGNMIGLYSIQISPVFQTMYGSTANPAYVHDPNLSYKNPLSLFQRLRTIIYQSVMKLMILTYASSQQVIADRYFGKNIPPLGELAKNFSLLFQNSHPNTGYPNPQTQMFVDIGGPPFHLHRYQNKHLPKDLQDFMDSAKDGVIYFSLGSNIRSSALTEEKRSHLLNAFRQIKQKVLWKWETEHLPGRPDNVKIQKWMPQTDVLAHPNLRGFITQGGLQSIGEATHYTIPMIVVPFVSDQYFNARKLETVGASITIDFNTFTEQDILMAINNITGDPKYKENMVKYSELSRDQPQSPMERAVWWTEYVLRHKGAKHLRSAAVDMPWYQYFMLDVLAFLAAALGSVLYVLYFICTRLYRTILRNFKTKTE